MTLPDVQALEDERGVEIDRVGVSGIRYPITVPMRDGDPQHTVADLSVSVHLNQNQKGVHMSRLMEALNDYAESLSPENVKATLQKMRGSQDASCAYMRAEFPLFLEREAPVTAKVGLVDYTCIFEGVAAIHGYDKTIGVVVNATSVCPCSKAMCEHGAHNQRCEIVVTARPNHKILWYEELIDLIEAEASCQLYSILKRPDEQAVTQRGYENAKFTEDIVRDITSKLQALRNILWFQVSVRSWESIHNHEAFAKKECGTKGPLLTLWRNGAS